MSHSHDVGNVPWRSSRFGDKLVPSFYSCKLSSGMVRLESVRMLPKMYHQIVMLFVLSYVLAIWRGSSNTLQNQIDTTWKTYPLLIMFLGNQCFFPHPCIFEQSYKLCCAPTHV